MLSIVLKRHDFRESDQFITLFTDESGKREALARGVKKITSKLSAYLTPFFIIETELVPGKETDLLIMAQPYQVFRNIPVDFEKMSVVGYAVQLVDALTVLKHPEPRIFSLLASFLAACDGGGHDSETVVASFTLKLLALLGWQPELMKCLVCGKVLGNEPGQFSVAEGGVRHATCPSVRQPVAGVPDVFLSSADRIIFQKLLTGSWDEQVKKVSEQILSLSYVYFLYHQQGSTKIGRFRLTV